MIDDTNTLKTRIKRLRKSSGAGKSVLYVMSRDQRVADNHALLCAQKHAIANELPLAVVFCLQERAGYRAREHFDFMIEGLKQVEADLKKMNIPFLMLIGNPKERLTATFHHLQPDSVYFDMNPLRGPKSIQQHFTEVINLQAGMYVVDNHNVVPVWVASDKQETGAYTLRPKIHKLLSTYLVEPEQIVHHPHAWHGRVQTLEELSPMIDEILHKIPSNRTKTNLVSGELAAKAHLEKFINTKLCKYGDDRNDPSLDGQSDLSAYLHFGQISSLRVAMRLREEALESGNDLHLFVSSKMPQPISEANPSSYSIDALIEEMIIRKELADNFCYYNENYDKLLAAPNWAQISLEKHSNDPREFEYSFEELKNAVTHDNAWNAAQKQLSATGKIHGYMRMYWAKKVLEWSPRRTDVSGILDIFLPENDMDSTGRTAARSFSSKETANNTQLISPSNHGAVESKISHIDSLYGAEWAIEVLKYLNDFYSLDGGDPNSYAGILWSVAGVHDRPWRERDVFGVIRYMNYAGLKRKFDIETYEQKWL